MDRWWVASSGQGAGRTASPGSSCCSCSRRYWRCSRSQDATFIIELAAACGTWGPTRCPREQLGFQQQQQGHSASTQQQQQLNQALRADRAAEQLWSGSHGTMPVDVTGYGLHSSSSMGPLRRNLHACQLPPCSRWGFTTRATGTQVCQCSTGPHRHREEQQQQQQPVIVDRPKTSSC